MEDNQANGYWVTKMLILASEAHLYQFDRAGQPYILHPLHVMIRLNTTDEELQCIALGHDLIEDTFVTRQLLFDRGFSDRVIDGIVGLTKQKDQSYEDYQKEVCKTRDRMLVKREDLRHNCDLTRFSSVGLSITDSMIQRQQRYLDFIDLIHKKLLNT